MATCPRCYSRDNMVVESFGKTMLRAKPIGSFSLAGAQMKVSMQEIPVYLLSCESYGCGWNCDVFMGADIGRDDGYMYPVSPEETVA